MFGRIVRAPLMALAGGLMGAILAYILAPMVDIMAVDAAEDNMLVQSFEAISEHATFVMLGAVLLGLLYGAVVESSGSGGGYP